MHPSYTNVALHLEAFRSVRRDGSVATNLVVRTNYGDPGETPAIPSPESNLTGEEWFMGPLRQIYQADGTTVVYRRGFPWGGDELRLTVDRRLDGEEVALSGRWLIGPASVVGSYAYNMRCQARIVRLDQTRIQDQTQT